MLQRALLLNPPSGLVGLEVLYCEPGCHPVAATVRFVGSVPELRAAGYLLGLEVSYPAWTKVQQWRKDGSVHDAVYFKVADTSHGVFCDLSCVRMRENEIQKTEEVMITKTEKQGSKKKTEKQDTRNKGTKRGGLGSRVTAKEKTIEDTKKELVGKEKSLESIRNKLEKMEMEKLEITIEEQRLTKEKLRLKKEEQTVNQKRENLVQVELEVNLDCQKINESIKSTAKKLEEQEQELRALLEEGISAVGSAAGRASQGGHVEFLLAAIEEKERSLECPVCFAEAAPPIFGCSQFHVVCGGCRAGGRLVACPTCREGFGAKGPGGNRFAEERATDLAKLRGELERVTS